MIKKLLAVFIILSTATPELIAETVANQVQSLSIEELLNTEVISVSKKAQSLSDAPAAVFVINQDDIKRIGATSIPEVLRIAPGIDVARINASKWAVTARGFNGNFANKLLVLIDGRSVYTPAFSGVYWDSQDVMLEDVERIEVIRGPGATLWGANAVNGVINIITKSAEKTQGGKLVAGVGTKEQGFSALRYGFKFADDSFIRAYVKGFNHDEFPTESGNNAGDDWNKVQGGFRIDSRFSNTDELTVQGDIFQVESNQRLTIPSFTATNFSTSIEDKERSSGWNINSRYRHTLSATEEISLQFYYDHYNRSNFTSDEERHTLDLDFQHVFDWGERQNIIWGLNYRYSTDDFHNTAFSSLDPGSRGVQLFTGFFQDEVSLFEDELWFTLGSKFEHNDYTGFEMQPSARLMWIPYEGHRIWAAVSRSVRTPSRSDHDINFLQSIVPIPTPMGNIPFPLNVKGSGRYRSEIQMSYELGYRVNFENTLSFDIAAFYTDYNRLRSTSSPKFTATGLEIEFKNDNKANTYGFEISSMWQMLPWWRWDANYSYLGTDITLFGDNLLAESPIHQSSLRAVITPIEPVNIDLFFRYVAEAESFDSLTDNLTTVDDYVSFDMRVAWKPVSNLELSIVGQNLLDNRHLEYNSEAFNASSQIPRSMYFKLDWLF